MFAPRSLRYYVGSKLRSDPVFAVAYELVRDSAEPILDVGCGIGLLAFYLRERGWSQPITGIDIDGRKIARAKEVQQRGSYFGLEFEVHDVAAKLPPACGHVVLFDVLHYLQSDEQQTLLIELAKRVAPDALLLLRDCPRDGSARFVATYVGELFAQMISWNGRTPLNFPTTDSIRSTMSDAEFSREIRPTWGATPFNNQLFIFRRRACAAQPAEESRTDIRGR
ncbi:MAG: class I SAM-dependent methyltransferase [Chthoniobacterales bacterium]|nr:class I SAM-dependent methyltransferase [Chthoniobacterales bacterium]